MISQERVRDQLNMDASLESPKKNEQISTDEHKGLVEKDSVSDTRQAGQQVRDS